MVLELIPHSGQKLIFIQIASALPVAPAAMRGAEIALVDPCYP
jgi:hypothetical protein